MICPYCGFVQYRNPYPAVSILIIENKKILLGKRRNAPGRGLWAVPSGYIEYDEDFQTTAIREAREETGLSVELKSILNVSSSFLSPDLHFLGLYVLARVTGGELIAGDDLEKVSWFPLNGPLPEMAFDLDKEVIQLLNQGSLYGLPISN